VNALSKKLRGGGDGSIMFWCPGCDGMHGIRVGDGSGPRWGYNGDPEKPTFTPSILSQYDRAHPPVNAENLEEWKRVPWVQTKVHEVCHSFVTDGRIQFLNDCTHELAGQTVDIPDWDDHA
jgi:hypothetical protein